MTHNGVEPGFIFEPSQPDPGLPEGVIDPSVPEVERLRSGATRESLFLVGSTRPRDEVITQEQLAPIPSPTVEAVEDIGGADITSFTDNQLQFLLLEAGRDRPRDNVSDALDAIDAAAALGDPTAGMVFAAAPGGSINQVSDLFELGSAAALLDAQDAAAEADESLFEKFAGFVDIDPAQAKKAAGQAVLVVGGLLLLPVVLPIIINAFTGVTRSLSKSVASATGA